MVNIAVLGYGTVGSGVVEVIRTNQKLIDQRVGEELRIICSGFEGVSGRPG